MNQRPRYRCHGCGNISAWRPGAICARCVRERAREIPPAVLEARRRDDLHAQRCGYADAAAMFAAGIERLRRKPDNA